MSGGDYDGCRVMPNVLDIPGRRSARLASAEFSLYTLDRTLCG